VNHTQVSTTAIYARLNLDPVREALEHNAALMLSAGLSQPTTGKVPEGSRRPTMIPAANARPAPSQTLRLGWVELSRQELYEKVWSQPALTLAQEFRISDRGLGKSVRGSKLGSAPRLLAETLCWPTAREGSSATTEDKGAKQDPDSTLADRHGRSNPNIGLTAYRGPSLENKSGTDITDKRARLRSHRNLKSPSVYVAFDNVFLGNSQLP
jgi:hypothetical protein